MALGLTHDARFGPLLMVAGGGTDLDLWAGQVFLTPRFGADRTGTH